MRTIAPQIELIKGAHSWSFASDRVKAHLTRDGGQLGPVVFLTDGGPVDPMAIAPWSEEQVAPDTDPLLKKLRGDFFCAPFGANAEPWRGRKLPLHGETASRRWVQPEIRVTPAAVEFSARMETRLVPGLVTKTILLRNGETNVYSRHLLEGFATPLSVGHHAMLSFPAERGPGFITLSPWREGRVSPKQFEAPESGGYSSLKIGAAFSSLRRVPLAAGGMADLTVYPAREGFEDLVMVSARNPHRMAWTAVCFPQARFAWFALKDPRTLASTVLWHSNGGRHYPPWSGRHRRILGLEEITGYFHYGLAQSVASNELSRRGVATVLHLKPRMPTAINYIMGVASIPSGFDRVKSISPNVGGVLIKAESGATVHHEVDLDFLGLAARRSR